MLGTSTSQKINCSNSGFASSSSDDNMDSLFHNDWLHEHNLDILFDLFEEELEAKDLDTNYTDSSTIFGTSPAASYLFGTSPLLASTLDLYDLLYLDNLQPITPVQQHHHHHFSYHNHNVNHHHHYQLGHQQHNIAGVNDVSSDNFSNLSGRKTNVPGSNCYNGRSQKSNTDSNVTGSTNRITDAMKIKRRTRKGQSEGVSLLARPQTNIDITTGGSKILSSSSGNSRSTSTSDKNNSDKISSKLLISKKSVLNTSCTSKSIDINYSKRNQHSNRFVQRYQHIQSVTGRAVTREHAYAKRRQ